MSELSLYRKYRPDSFDSVLGQDHIISVLRGALEAGNLAHAYLFSGSRGTGKTSVARILAKGLETSQNDLYEIDAASNRGIDEVRALREAVNVLPFESKYKIYIIDEVHMMTKDAFNALLKTLEEPPKHVIFILATTEPEKLPDTITSRCQSFRFNKPSKAILKEMVSKVAKLEKIKIDDPSANLIAFLGDGSFRDTYGILQKVISASTDDKITIDEVRIATGSPDREMITDFITALIEGKKERGLETIKNVVSTNLNVQLFVKFLAERIRQIILYRISKKICAETFSLTDDELSELETFKDDKKINSNLLRKVLNSYSEVEYFYAPEISLEILLEEFLEKNE